MLEKLKDAAAPKQVKQTGGNVLISERGIDAASAFTGKDIEAD